MTSHETFPECVDTPRLTLRQFEAGDTAALAQLIDRNRTRLLRSFPDMARDLNSLEDASAYIGGRVAQWSEARLFAYGIWRTGDAALIGQLTVKNIVWDLPSAELSYFMDRGALRQGFATEAIGAILQIALGMRGFERVFVRVIAGNAASLALARKLGFRHEGVHRNDFRCGLGEIHDVHYLSVTSREYAHRQAVS